MSRPTKLAGRSPLLAIYAILVFAFLYLPIVVLVLYSFNREGVGGFPPKQLTLAWYRLLFSDSAIWDSVLNSLLVAISAVALSLTLGLLAALALDRATFPGKSIFRRIGLLPLILPGIITGLPRRQPLPVEIAARLLRGIAPGLNAISALIFAASVILILIWYQLRPRTTGKEAQEVLERP